MDDIIGYCGSKEAAPMLVDALSLLQDGRHAGLAILHSDGLFRLANPDDAQYVPGKCGFLHTRSALFSTQKTVAVVYAGKVRYGGDFRNLIHNDPTQFVSSLAFCLQSVEGACAMLLLHRDYPNLIVGVNYGLPLILGLCQDGWFLSTTEWGLPSSCKHPMALPVFSFCVLAADRCDRYDMEGNPLEDCSYFMDMRVMHNGESRRVSRV